jgi:DTW domain-containing protein YfiP
VRQKGQQTHTISEARATCYACYRPRAHCVCGYLQPFEAHTKLLLLQHPNEWRKYYSTAKLVKDSISNSQLWRDVTFPPEKLQRAIESHETFLLYPGSDAVDCEEVPLSSHSRVIVIDGTWDEAQKIVYRNPILHSVPRISFRKPLSSTYRIRRPPKGGYLSTVESIAHLLIMNAVASGCAHKIPTYQGLFEVFNEMVNRQLKHMGREAEIRV